MDIKCLLPVPQYVGVGGCCCKAGIDLLIEFFSVNFTNPFLKKKLSFLHCNRVNLCFFCVVSGFHNSVMRHLFMPVISQKEQTFVS